MSTKKSAPAKGVTKTNKRYDNAKEKAFLSNMAGDKVKSVRKSANTKQVTGRATIKDLADLLQVSKENPSGDAIATKILSKHIAAAFLEIQKVRAKK